MVKAKNKNSAICSITDFEKQFYPQTHRKISLETIHDPKVVGTKLAERSLKKIKYHLTKKR